MKMKILVMFMFLVMLSSVMAYESTHDTTMISGVVIDFIGELGIAVIEYSTLVMLVITIVAIIGILTKRAIKGEKLWE